MRNYIVNLDPAVRKTGYTANIDIRDTVDYKQVMTEYGLGPNGAIMTSLNLFATRFDQVIELIGKRSGDLEYVNHFALYFQCAGLLSLCVCLSVLD